MIPFALWSPSMGELSIVLILVVILFGLGKLPQAFGQLGKAVKSFRDAQKGDDEDDVRDVTPKRRVIEDVEDAEEIRTKEKVER